MGPRQLKSLFSHSGPVDEMLLEQTRVCFKKMGLCLRELEKWKLKHGYCILGRSCLRKAIEGPHGAVRGCAEHHAAMKAGMKLGVYAAFETAYGRMQKEAREAEREAARLEAEEEKTMRSRPKMSRIGPKKKMKMKKERPSRRRIAA